MEDRQKQLINKIENTIRYRNSKSKRLLSNEAFVQHINIVYSCFGAFLSVWSLLVVHKSISFVATIVSIILVLSITYLNSQRYAARANDLAANILDLRNLEAELQMQLNKEEILKKETTYNSCLAASEDENDYDKLYCDIFEYHLDTDKLDINKFRYFQFYTILIFKFIFKIIIVLLPFITTALLVYLVLIGEISILDSIC